MYGDDKTRVDRTADLIAEAASAMQWPTPRPIESRLPPAPAFNGEAMLPDLLRDFVMDEAERMPCPPDFIASALIVAFGSVIGARCAIRPKQHGDWLVPANLWGAVVGDPSTKKTPSVSVVMGYISRLEQQAAEQLSRQMKQHEADLAAYEAHRTALKVEMKKAAREKSEFIGKIDEFLNLEPPATPVVRRFRVNDCTTAALSEIQKDNPDGLLVYRDELMGLLASWDRQGNDGDRSYYLEAWNGCNPYDMNRVGRGRVFIENHCLSVFGGIQPDLAGRYLRGVAHAMDNDGRVQRFQVLVFPEPVAWQWRDRSPLRGVRERVQDLFHHLATLDPLEAGASPATTFARRPSFVFDSEAQDFFIEWSTKLNRDHIPNEFVPLMRQHLAKYERLFCSVALILHLTAVQPGPEVKLKTVMRAAAWCEYLQSHARRFYGLLEVETVSAAASLSRRLAAGKLADGFTTRDVQRKGWAGLDSVALAEQAIRVLEEHGHVAGTEYQHPAGGPQTIRYNINPALFKDGTT